MTQKLIVVKGKTNQQLAQYMLTLIPDGDYYGTDKKDLSNRFIHSGDKNNFSGVAVYALWESGIPIRVDKYKSGQRVGSINLLGVKGATKEKIAQIRKIFASLRITRASSGVRTRNYGEDDWSGGSGCYFCDGGGCLICDTTCPGCGGGGCIICGIDIDPVEAVGCGICMQSDCICDYICPFCGGYPCACPDICLFCGSAPCACSDICPSCGYDPCQCNQGCIDCGTDPCTCDDDDGSPSFGEEEPGLPPIIVQDILDRLKQNPRLAKLFENVKVDRIKVTPRPPGKDQQQGVTHKDGSIEIHDRSPIVLLEELMHRFQLDNDIHGDYKGNKEIEAKLLVWDFLTSEYSMNGIEGSFGPAWTEFGKFADNPCQETWGDALSALYRMGYDSSGFPTSDYSDFKDDNYQNLK